MIAGGMDMGMEKRNCTRVVFESEALVHHKGRSLRGSVENLSLNGLFLRIKETIPLDETIEVEILLSGTSSKLTVNIQGLVVRQDADGVALQIVGMDLDSFIHYKNIITYISGDEREIMGEFHRFVARRGREA
jgi:hypothetical protein